MLEGQPPGQGLFEGIHFFIIEETEPGICNFVHGESFRGLLVEMILKRIGNATQEGFVKMNETLRTKAESL